ncbi:hypothetical protein A2962_05570 [Candidatus Woesebacteria bacterium RIFCSPLOWO2_01_FULL_39_61]|uniref:TrpR like protein, YerC/YecD n=2 Tax=Microgenomates group TaxID=1794810 RepID=A0A0H4TQ84_9BACT|nr:hypothetical protein [uncultured Microgenomates bacterium Rifle_16ft_4_minimus_37836]OGM28056.1 MAG: hypothetical protein A2692_05310 [Candidatus Woesebacteria bacterium RIFCSPHIGHO2_01_FULL_39_95]OGM34044.1 MAG: hypothetical protein A3D01_03880 [Candidatus Woesebacteria bacterium RIFCSPHIGHO2_02_FULL_39_13]OGM38302.1 MAG: hypothetical protein A3E13_05990 [Candidatus Woesebacteria bacterium RIFCSPHIGHO2_12_FULL_40_20]OGM67765.1 MAG: hypothetical protein A2962_05570 [Candidatus Woesebacteria 
MRRYKFLGEDSVFAALNKLRTSFFAANDGLQVDEIIKGILTYDERMKIGRRIQIAQLLDQGLQYREIMKELKVGLPTIMLVSRKMDQNPRCFELIMAREEKVEKEYKGKAYKKVGESKIVFERKEYTGFRRKNVKR